MIGLLRPALVSSLLLALAGATPAVAQTSAGTLPPTFAGDITVTSTGVATEAVEVPVATTVISMEEMEDSQSENAADRCGGCPA